MHLTVAPKCSWFMGMLKGCVGGEAFARLRDGTRYDDSLGWFQRDWLTYHNSGFVSDWGTSTGAQGLTPGWLVAWIYDHSWSIPAYIWFEFEATIDVCFLFGCGEVLGIDGSWVYKGW